MSDNKKYYYLKLKDTFYDSEQLIILQNMTNGYLYSDILIKLYLRSLKNDGKLLLNNKIPYTSSTLSQILRHKEETVKKALNIFHDLGLVEILEDGTIYMSDIQNFIGNSSTEADRKREYRKQIENNKKMLCTNVQQMSDIFTPEIEKEKKTDKKIEEDVEVKTETKAKNSNYDIIFNFYSSNIIDNKNLNQCEKESLINLVKQFGTDLVIEAIKASIKRNKKSLGYVEAILKSWLDKGITTVNDISKKDNNNSQSEKNLKLKNEAKKENEELVARSIKKVEEEHQKKINENQDNIYYNKILTIINKKENDDDLECEN